MKINRNIFTLDSHARDVRYLLKEGNASYLSNRFRWYYYPRMHHVARFPIHVDIESSSECNMNCPMCFRGRLSVKHGIMDIGLYRRIIDECAAHHIYSVKLSWRGEPLLNPALPQMVAYAKEKGIKEVAFLTNGLVLEESLAAELIRSGLDWMTISFDGLGETYESIRRPARYHEAVERVRGVRRIRDRLGRSKPLLRVQTIWTAIEDDPDAYREVWGPIVDKVLFIPDKDFYSEIHHDTDFVCQYLWQRLTVTWNGKVTQCIGDTNEDNLIGDVNESTLHEIWHGAEMNHRRWLHLERRRLEIECCRQCPEGRVETTKGDREIPKDMGNVRG